MSYPQTSGAYTFQACYNDTTTGNDRALPANSGVVSSIDQCQQNASNQGYCIFGLQAGGQCWMGNDPVQAIKYGLHGGSCGALGVDNSNILYSKQPVVAAPPTAQKSSNGYNYEGCYNDGNGRMIPTFNGNVSTVDQCSNIATSQNASVFGIQYGGQCFTGTDFNQAKSLGQHNGDCGTMGSGVGWANLVYYKKPDQPQTSGNYNYQGCFNDKSTKAIPNYQGNVQSIDQCRQIAEVKGQNVFGVQNEGQCFTGNDTANNESQEYGSYNGECDLLGSSMANQVYKYQPSNNSQQQASGNYVYKGCYNDSGNRVIPTFRGMVSTIDQCQQIASQNAENVFGVQYGGYCFTGPDKNKAYSLGVNYSNCTKLGSGWTNQTYEYNGVSEPATSGKYVYKGCFNSPDNSSLPNKGSNVSNIDDCSSQAATRGYNIFGLKNGGECWMGDDLHKVQNNGITYTNCSQLGGTNTNQVYSQVPPVTIQGNPIYASSLVETFKLDSEETKKMYYNKYQRRVTVKLLVVLLCIIFLLFLWFVKK